jgi:hypothetical protein
MELPFLSFRVDLKSARKALAGFDFVVAAAPRETTVSSLGVAS